LYLRRDQHYLRSYRTHNLWLNMYHKKMRIPKINAWHVAIMRRMAKSVSTVSFTYHHPLFPYSPPTASIHMLSAIRESVAG